MKHYILTALLLAGLISCGKKEEPTPTPTVVGTWKFVSERVLVTPLSGGTSASGSTPLASSDLLTLQATGIAYSVINGLRYSPNGTYTYTGSLLTLAGTEHPGSYQVKTLTSTAMVLASTGTDGKFRYDVTDNLTRIL